MSEANENLELTPAEKAALVRLLKQTLDNARFPYAPRLDPLKAILAKIDPPPQPEPLRPLPPAGAPPSHGRYRKRRG